MDGRVDEMSRAYDALVDSISAYLWVIQMSSDQNTPFTNTALENFKDQYDAFKAACDKAEDFVDTERRWLAAEYLECTADLADTIAMNAAGESLGNADNVAEFMKQLLEKSSQPTEPSSIEGETATSMVMGQSYEHPEESMQMLVQLVAQVEESTEPNNAEASNSAEEKSEGSKISEDVMPDSAAEKPEGSKNSEDAKPDSPPKSCEDVKRDSAAEKLEGQGLEDAKPASPPKDFEDVKLASSPKGTEDVKPVYP